MSEPLEDLLDKIEEAIEKEIKNPTLKDFALHGVELIRKVLKHD